ncbi:MAG TPA: hypothetical protein VIL13_06490 [Longimicrobiales bacterium]|jgi:hypothetical protein
MSVSGILSGVGGAGLRPVWRGVEGERAESPGRGRAGQVQGEGALPSEPPPGTDPALWSVLTREEREFYARVQALGPLTYGPGVGLRPQDGIGRGGRIDVRV